MGYPIKLILYDQKIKFTFSFFFYFSPSRNENEIAILTNLYKDRFPKVSEASFLMISVMINRISKRQSKRDFFNSFLNVS